MRLGLAVWVLSGFLMVPTLASAQISKFKGWASVNRELTARIAPSGVEFEMEKYIPATGLEQLLGTWNSFGAEHSFKNGLPNPLNMLIWQVALKSVSGVMGRACSSTQIRYHQKFVAILQKLCTWPAATAKDQDVLMDFWLSLMGYNAPESEFTAWQEFFTTSSYKNRKPDETIEAMAFAIFMNPYFLLNR